MFVSRITGGNDDYMLDRGFVSFFFFSSRRRHTRLQGDWSSDVCSSDLRIRHAVEVVNHVGVRARVAVEADRALRLVLTAPDVEYLHAPLKCSFRRDARTDRKSVV